MESGNSKYGLLMEQLPDAFVYCQIVTDDKGNPVDYIFLHVNRAFEEMFELPRSAVMGKKIIDIFPDNKVSPFGWIDPFGKATLTGETLRFEHYYKPRDCWYEITAYSDEPGYFVVFFRDITEIKQAEEKQSHIEWMLHTKKTGSLKDISVQEKPPYGSLTQFNTTRFILDSIGEDMLSDMAKEYLNLLETSTAIYEKNGDYALGIFSSGWCRFLDNASRYLCQTDDNRHALQSGKWLCHESCWTNASKVAIETGEPVDIACHGGLRLYAVPIWAEAEVVGAINFGYGDPPQEPGELQKIAHKYEVNPDVLRKHAEAYESRPPFIIELAKERLHSSARLIGALLERKQALDTLQASEERFRYIAQFSPLPMAIIDSKGYYEYLNPAFMELFGYTITDIPTGKVWFKRAYPDPDYRQQAIAAWKNDYASLKKNVVFPRFFTVTCKDGQAKEILFRTVLMDNGKYLIIYEDITERKQAEQKLAEYTLELEQLYRHLDAELDKARQVHERTLPKSFPAVAGLSLAPHYQPAQTLGGDFYDIIHKDNKLIFYLSDVSGHGLDGAMLSVFVKHTIKSHISFTPADGLTPAGILRHLAGQFSSEDYPEELYVCLFMAVLDLTSMELSYCGAGFQEAMLVKLGSGEKLKLISKGLFITSYLPLEILKLKENSITLTPGSTLLCNTDGLTEQVSEGATYRDRLPDVFFQNANLPAHLVAQAVVEDFRQFNNGSLQGKDDITFLVLQVNKVAAYKDEPDFGGTISHDNTKQREEDNKLHKSEEIFRNLADSAQDFIFRCHLIPEISYEYMSPSVAAVTGYTPEDYYNDPDLVLRIVHPDDLPILKKMKSGKTSPDQPFNIRYVRKNGEIVWTEEHIVPFYDEDGNLVAIEGNVRDITGRIELEQTLKETEARNRALLDAIPDIMFVFNREGEFIDYKANGGLILPPDEFMYKKVSQVLPSALARLTLERLGKVFQTGKMQQYEYQAEIANELRHYESRLVPCGTDKALAIIRDITEKKKVEETLRESEENLDITLNSIGDAVIATDAAGLIVRMNPVAEKLCACSSAEALGRPLSHVFRIINTLTGESVADPVKTVLQTGKVVGLANHTTLIARDGSDYQIADSAAPIITPEGRTTGVVLVFQDVSGDYRLRQQISESEVKYRSLFEQSVAGIYLHDLEGNIIDVNEEACSQSGYTRDELLQMRVFDLHPNKPDTINMPNDEILQHWKQWQPGQRISMEAEHQHKDGTIIPIQLSTGLVLDKDKKIMLAIVQDISERKQAEEALRRREEEFRALAENAPDIVIRFDRNYRHVYANPAIEKETGIPREQFIGKTHLELGWPSETAKARTDVLREVFETAKERTYYFKYKSPKGWKHYHARNVPEFSPDGTVETVLTITRDITTIKEMEAALYQERVKIYRMHQRAIPDEFPESPGLALAASCRPAAKLQGDYYNVLRRKGQLLVYLVDIEAGRDDGVMQSLYVRKTMEDYLQAHDDDAPVSPALLLRYLNERYEQEREGGKIPLCVLIALFDYHPSSGHPKSLRYVSSGFCTPPLMLKGTADPGGLPLENLYLAIDEGAEPVEHSLTIEPGSTFIFSTDGLINQGPDSGSYELRLQEVLRHHAHLPPELISRAVETDFDQFFSESPLQNDLAFIVAQVPRQEQRLSFKVESDFRHIEEATEKVTTFLAQHLGYIPELIDFHELLVNAIEHGNKWDGEKTATVEMVLTDRFYKVIITDQGEGFNWRERINKELDWEGESERGRGIIMTRMMTDYLGYNERGNRVTMINLID